MRVCECAVVKPEKRDSSGEIVTVIDETDLKRKEKELIEKFGPDYAGGFLFFPDIEKPKDSGM